ncbi:MAG: hypothetical protein AAFQ63_13760 [Cyanobacteria bacterium J06621_11]
MKINSLGRRYSARWVYEKKLGCLKVDLYSAQRHADDGCLNREGCLPGVSTPAKTEKKIRLPTKQ